MDWGGFSDEDLRRMKLQSQGGPIASGMAKQSASAKAGRLGTRTNQRKPGNETSRPQKSIATRKSSSPDTIANSQTTHQTSLTPQQVEKDSSMTQENTRLSSQKDKQDESVQEPLDKNVISKPETADSNSTKKPPETIKKELGDKEGISRDLSKAEHFQIQQKVMEGQNKKKAELLTSAIMQRQKKAKAEASKLIVIQKELAQLDRMVNNDVSILRNQIEEACMEFMDAQKRYEKAEIEFVESKIEWHKKGERKDQLTEHLYTVIHQNEIRKAKKLADLMCKLEMEAADEAAAELQTSLMDMPQLTAVSPGSVQTLKDPHSRHKKESNLLLSKSSQGDNKDNNQCNTEVPETPVISRDSENKDLSEIKHGNDISEIKEDNQNKTVSVPSNDTDKAPPQIVEEENKYSEQKQDQETNQTLSDKSEKTITDENRNSEIQS